MLQVPELFQGSATAGKTEHSGRMKNFFRSALVLIHAAASGVCSKLSEDPMQGKARMGTVFQPVLTPYRRGVDTSGGSAAREANSKTKMLGKMKR